MADLPEVERWASPRHMVRSMSKQKERDDLTCRLTNWSGDTNLREADDSLSLFPIHTNDLF